MSPFQEQYIVQPPPHEGASSHLIGEKLIGKKGETWLVKERIQRKSNSSGGTFSIGYIVENSKGEKHFMKATDTALLAGAGDIAKALQIATSEHLFEREILDFCQGNRMDKIVHATDYGDLSMVHEGVRETVFFIIFELADGDARSIVDKDKGYDFLWLLIALSNLTKAVRQLHQKEISHNDIKPSNLLLFQKLIQKLGDMGRATHGDISSPHDGLPHPGDMTYASPEQLYRIENLLNFHGKKTSADVRRASDLYLLGSMGYYFITGLPITTSILNIMADEIMPVNWTGPFEEVLPYWKDAFGKAMIEFENSLPRNSNGEIEPVALELQVMVKQLCEPEPLRRGNPLNNSGDRYSVERYISSLDRMIHKYKVGKRL